MNSYMVVASTSPNQQVRSLNKRILYLVVRPFRVNYLFNHRHSQDQLSVGFARFLTVIHTPIHTPPGLIDS